MLLTVTFAVVQSGQRAVKQYVCISFAGLLFVSRTSHLRLQPLPQPSCSAVLLRASKGFICISAASVGVVHPDSMGASQSSLEKPQESESAAAAVAATAAPPHAHQQQASPSTSASAKHATSSSAAADAAVHSKPHVPWSKRLAKAAVWAIRVVLVVEGAALAKAVLVRSLGGSSGSTTSSEEPSDAVDKLVDYLAGRRDADVLVPLGSEELLAAGEELDTEDLGRLGYTATSAELRQLLGKVVEARREAIGRAAAAQQAADAGGAEGGAQQAAVGKDGDVNSSRLRRPVLRRQPALHGQQAAEGTAAAATGSRPPPG